MDLARWILKTGAFCRIQKAVLGHVLCVVTVLLSALEHTAAVNALNRCSAT